MHTFHWKQPPKGVLVVKTLWKFRTLGCFSKSNTEECGQKVWNIFEQIAVGKPCSTTYFLEVGARVSLKLATKGFLRGKNTLKIYLFRLFSKAKTEECDQKVSNVFDQFDIAKPFSTTHFLEVGARISLKLAIKGFLRGKKLWKFTFSGCFSKAKTEECNQKVWDVFDQIGVGKPCSTTYFLEVGVCVSLKLATKGFLRAKKTENWALQVVFLKQKRRSATKKCGMCLINLVSVNLVQQQTCLKKLVSFKGY